MPPHPTSWRSISIFFFPSTSGSSKWSPSLRFPHQNPVCHVHPVLHTCHDCIFWALTLFISRPIFIRVTSLNVMRNGWPVPALSSASKHIPPGNHTYFKLHINLFLKSLTFFLSSVSSQNYTVQHSVALYISDTSNRQFLKKLLVHGVHGHTNFHTIRLSQTYTMTQPWFIFLCKMRTLIWT